MSAAVEVVAVGAHPDDVELGCGATLARLARLGRRTAIVDLTRGELGSRGTAEQRADEAARAAAILGVAERINLGLPDGGIDPLAEGQRLALVEALRRLRPRLLLLPWIEARHPDHVHAARLGEEAAFRAGLHRLGAGANPHRPALVLHYMERVAFEPTLIARADEDYAAKRAAIRAHRSQFERGPGDPGPETFLTRPDFLAALEARDRWYGDLAGFRFGEPFRSRTPLAVSDLAALAGGEP